MQFPIDVTESDFKISTHYKRSCCLSFSPPPFLFYLIYWSASSLLSSSLWGISPASGTNYYAASAHLPLYFGGDSWVVFVFFFLATHLTLITYTHVHYSSGPSGAGSGRSSGSCRLLFFQYPPLRHITTPMAAIWDCSHSKSCQLRQLSSLRSCCCCCCYFWPLLAIGNATIRACCKHIQAESATATAPQANVTNFTKCKQTATTTATTLAAAAAATLA